MKFLLRLIGFLVVVMILAALSLYTLNSFGYLHGPISKWINDISLHCQGSVNDTIDFLENQDLIPFPTSQPNEGTPALNFQAP